MSPNDPSIANTLNNIGNNLALQARVCVSVYVMLCMRVLEAVSVRVPRKCHTSPFTCARVDVHSVVFVCAYCILRASVCACVRVRVCVLVPHVPVTCV